MMIREDLARFLMYFSTFYDTNLRQQFVNHCESTKIWYLFEAWTPSERVVVLEARYSKLPSTASLLSRRDGTGSNSYTGRT